MCSEENRSIKKDVILLSVFLSLVIIWFLHVFLFKNVFCFGDIPRYFYPLRKFGVAQIRSGQVPLWNPYVFFGTPFLAELQTVLFYPVSLFYYLIPDFDTAFNVFIVFHFFLGGAFIYILMRYWNFSYMASFISAIVYAFSGYMNSVIVMNTSLSSAVWIPLVLLFFDKSLRTKRFWYVVITGIFITIQFLAGNPDLLYFTLWVLLFYTTGYIYLDYRKNKTFINVIKYTGFFAVSSSIWIPFSAIQLFPFVEFLLSSTRAYGRDFASVTHWSLPPFELLNFFIPFAFGDITKAGTYWGGQHWLASYYVGIVPLFFIFLAIIFDRSKKTSFFTFLTVISLIMAFGSFTPIYSFCYKLIPGFKHIRYPVKYLFITTFSLSILSGIGYEFVRKRLKTGIDNTRFIRGLIIFNVIFSLTLVIFFIFWKDLLNFLQKFAVTDSGLDAVKFRQMLYVYLNASAEFCQIIIFFSITCLLTVMIMKNKLRGKILNYMLVALIFADLYSINSGLTKILPASDLRIPPESLRKISDDKTLFRIFRTPEMQEINKYVYGRDYRKGLLARLNTWAENAPMIYGFYDSLIYGSLQREEPVYIVSYMQGLQNLYETEMLNMLNIKYIMSQDEIDNEDYELIHTGLMADRPIQVKEKLYEKYYMYKNKRNLERAYIVDEALMLKDRMKILETLSDKDFNPRKRVIIEKKPVYKSEPRDALPEEFTHITKYEPNEVLIDVNVKFPKFLVLADSFYPGWEVYVDGKRDEIFKANFFLRAACVNKGRHIVKFIYRPFTYRLGMAVTFLSLSIVFILLRRKLPLSSRR